VPIVLAKVGVIKRIKRLESKSNLNNGTSGGTMPIVLAKLGIMKEIKKLGNILQPHNKWHKWRHNAYRPR
jgi:hypothetical protein